ncbi:carboxypeptidase regulatory-like domain-containing protein [Alteromonas stellipolaris]|uniref:carboxypeptidase regulatory-like domain-containing protein n=1 Tax=Alteromonas stellipolaris TaxID=233316 RepID=UPI0035673731
MPGLKITEILHSLLFVLLMSLFCSFGANAEVLIDDLSLLSPEQVVVQYNGGRYDRRTGQMQYVATYTNVSGEELKGPFYLEIADISSTRVTVVNPSDTTSAGNAVFVSDTDTLEDGLTIEFSVIFSGRDRISYSSNAYNEKTIVLIDSDNDGVYDHEDECPNTPSGTLVAANGCMPLNTEPTVTIDSPVTLSTFGHSPVLVTGTVSEDVTTLTLNGIALTPASGQFEAQVALTEGHNVIVARTVDTNNNVETASITVSLDLTPPYVTLESHEDGDVVYTDKITVTGLVNDIVRGTVESTQANVKANGQVGEVSNRSYVVKDVPLEVGDNVIEVSASDQVGNTDKISFNIEYKLPIGKKIELNSGQDQSAPIGDLLSEPLSVKVSDDSGNPLANEAVIFRVTQGAGLVAYGDSNEGRAVVVDTDAEGIASTKFGIGARVGKANHKVSAKVVGFDGAVSFVASGLAKIGDKISVNSGNNQRGIIGQPLPSPFVVAVTDIGSNVVSGARVKFEVLVGGGVLQNGKGTYETTTDSDGRASAILTLGQLHGLDAQRVNVTLIDAPEGDTLTAGFLASGFEAADPADTTISGVVLSNQDEPLEGVTVRVDGTTRESKTDGQGRFEIDSVPVGPVHLIADGSTVKGTGEYPALSYRIVTIAGVENPLSSPIYMVKLNLDNAVYAGKEDVSLTLEKFPGFKLDIAKDSVTFPDGSREGFVSVTPVNAAAVPMAPPNGMQPQFIVTIQPTGTQFYPPAKLTLPNVDGHSPGAQVEMYSFDHDLEEFVAIGLGTVTEDGSLVESNPGVGVVKAGWHCGSQPGGSGCCENKKKTCDYCSNKVGSCPGTCEFVPDRIAEVQTPGNCQKEYCGPSKEDNSDIPTNDVVGDCKKPGCEAGSATEIADPSDIKEEDKECNECSGLELTNKPDGTPIKDDVCQECQGGVKVKAYDDQWSSIGGAFTSNPGIDIIANKLNRALAAARIKDSVTLTPSAGATIKTRDCCEQSTGVVEDGETEIEGSVTVGLDLPDIPIWGPPTISREVDFGVVIVDIDFEFGIKVKSTIALQISGGQRMNMCKLEDCYYANLDTQFSLSPTAIAEAIVCAETLWTSRSCGGVSVTPASLAITFKAGVGVNRSSCNSGVTGTIDLAEIKFIASASLGVPGSSGFVYEKVLYSGGTF